MLDQLLSRWLTHQAQREQTTRELRAFARNAPVREREAREVLSTIPYVGPVTIDVVLSELGRLRRGIPARRETDADGDGDVRRLLSNFPCTNGLTTPFP